MVALNPSLSGVESFVRLDESGKKSLNKISSGYSINKAADDASGLAIATKLQAEASSLSQAASNTNSAIAMTQIADGAMGNQSEILDKIRSELVKASNGTLNDEDRAAIAKNINKYIENLDNIASQTNYNGINLLQKSADDTGVAEKISFQVGEDGNDTIQNSADIQANSAGLAKDANKTLTDLKTDTSGDGTNFTADLASQYLDTIDTAINDLNVMRSDIASTQNQLSSNFRNILTQKTNISDAVSTIIDTDYINEISNFNKSKVLTQANIFASVQANANMGNVLQLLS